ncbi:MAG: DNA-directed RNA polymerase subunit alpha [Parcubacteria group bacterium]|nr:DNA-directed RNA polymerase subunit alpha [Parcubacteria group bacterium]
MIPLPQKIKIINKKDNQATFEIEGLSPGYGMTVGNSLRRVLLSSLEGSAVTLVKIKGAAHEFSTIPGVLENVIDILLNLKQVRFKLHSKEPKRLFLKVKGEKDIKAGDFEKSTDVEVITKDVHIVTLSDPTSQFEMEIEISRGLGFQPSEFLKREKIEIGAIAVDAIFSPIRKVNYEVEDMRVGERTDFNRLSLFVETDGSISPEEAFISASKILVDHFSFLKDFQESGGKEKEKKEMIEIEDILKTKVSDLNLSIRTLNALNESGIKTVGGLIKKTESSLGEIGGLGEKGIKEIKKALGKLNLTFKEEK